MPDITFEKNAYENGRRFVCGIDEAGRGPLCGPVYAAAVILPAGLTIDGLDDSKKLSAKKREILFEIIKEKAVDYSIAFATENEIDEINILNATFLAMRRAARGLKNCDYALVDGNRIKDLGVDCECIVQGDGKCASIAAASIIAKVTRDRYMEELDKIYPQYKLAVHKGYATPEHIALLRAHGPCGIYRKSFLKNILGEKDA